jgi:hypothetical protein
MVVLQQRGLDNRQNPDLKGEAPPKPSRKLSFASPWARSIGRSVHSGNLTVKHAATA